MGAKTSVAESCTYYDNLLQVNLYIRRKNSFPDTILADKLVHQSSFTELEILDRCGNDPSAGSPTETLLRLHLPLNDKV